MVLTITYYHIFSGEYDVLTYPLLDVLTYPLLDVLTYPLLDVLNLIQDLQFPCQARDIGENILLCCLDLPATRCPELLATRCPELDSGSVEIYSLPERWISSLAKPAFSIG